ncbi:MAG: gephyrin-like molybdotransferase Glp [Thermodesulfobacteriota bacterium]
MELFQTLTVEEARECLRQHLKWKQSGDKVSLDKAYGLYLLKDVLAQEDIPSFDRSTMDGFAVHASDTFGASVTLPAYLEMAGETRMGQGAVGILETGKAWAIPTGGMLPSGADAVVMLEYTEELDERTIGITRPVAPGENVVSRGEDVSKESLVLRSGHRLRPQDLGLLAALGITTVEVRTPLKVGIISTGDEVVDIKSTPRPGQMRDVNSYTLYGLVIESGGMPTLYGVIPDDFSALQGLMVKALEENDLVLISGGSSVGARDVAKGVITSFGKPGILFHGISIRPGKPAIGAVVEGKPVFGLPGHPVSAMVVFDLLVKPLIKYNCYPDEKEGNLEFPLRAYLTRNVRSAAGREDYLRVKLSDRDGRLYAEPVLGKSGLIATMVRADGMVRIQASREGIEAGEEVEVKVF